MKTKCILVLVWCMIIVGCSDPLSVPDKPDENETGPPLNFMLDGRVTKYLDLATVELLNSAPPKPNQWVGEIVRVMPDPNQNRVVAKVDQSQNIYDFKDTILTLPIRVAYFYRTNLVGNVYGQQFPLTELYATNQKTGRRVKIERWEHLDSGYPNMFSVIYYANGLVTSGPSNPDDGLRPIKYQILLFGKSGKNSDIVNWNIGMKSDVYFDYSGVWGDQRTECVLTTEYGKYVWKSPMLVGLASKNAGYTNIVQVHKSIYGQIIDDSLMVDVWTFSGSYLGRKTIKTRGYWPPFGRTPAPVVPTSGVVSDSIHGCNSFRVSFDGNYTYTVITDPDTRPVSSGGSSGGSDTTIVIGGKPYRVTKVDAEKILVEYGQYQMVGNELIPASLGEKKFFIYVLPFTWMVKDGTLKLKN